jgi:hypothetical protein
MPERIIVPITTCKYASKKEDGIIKITKFDTNKKRNKTEDKKFSKKTIGIDKPTFQNFIVEIDNEKDAEKLHEFIDYLYDIDLGGCFNCKKNHAACPDMCSNDDNEIIIKCPDCFSNKIDSSQKSKYYVIWWNSILANYGLNFKDGFPKAVRAQWGTKCHECGGSHDGAGYEFNFNI